MREVKNEGEKRKRGVRERDSKKESERKNGEETG